MGMVSDRTYKLILVTLIPDTESSAQLGLSFAEQPSSICRAQGKVRKSNYQGSQCLVGVVSAIVVLLCAPSAVCSLCRGEKMLPFGWLLSAQVE